jgi:hypothetical protein
MHTLDSCRVSWGKVVAVDGAELLVDRQPLLLEFGKLVLGAPQRTRVVRQVSGRGFADAVQADDWVSLHWGWVCEVLTAQQQANVARYTQYHLTLANQTL